ncbi:hypothetical protein [Nocardia miyunensis]|uniref:hypothetical protein n=1 Tax=Nocardia miyunensis TaxID=282684 RepID=UPI000832BB6B|nr:hypothetical protein [Nocardia miyunensis]
MNGIDRIATNLESHLTITVLAALGAVVVACGAIWAVRSARRRGLTGEQAGTLLAAAIATGVSAQGMWVFFDKSLHLTLSLRIMFFAFLEIMVLTSALRARSAQQVSGTAGIDGVAMWVLTCLSAVLAATDADNVGTVLIRLSAPLVAAWGWERSMALERRRSGALGGINWRITPERMLIRLGIADPTDRTAGEAARQRRLIDVALAADHARTLRDTGAGSRRINRARRHLQRVMRRAVEDGGLVDNARAPRTVLMDNLRILSGTGALVDLDLPSPWTLDEESASDNVVFAAPALAASNVAGPAVGSHPTGIDELSAASPSASTFGSPESSGAQTVSTDPPASPDRAAPLADTPEQSRTRAETQAPTAAAANSSAGQSLPSAEQTTSAEARNTSSASAAGQVIPTPATGQPHPATAQTPTNGQALPTTAPPATGQPLPTTTQTPTPGQPIPTSASTQEAGQPIPTSASTQEAGQPIPTSASTQEAGQPIPATAQNQQANQTIPATAQTRQADQAIPATARAQQVDRAVPATAQTQQAGQTISANTQVPEAGQPLQPTAQTPEPDRNLPPTTQTPPAGQESSAVTQTLPTAQPSSKTAWTWREFAPASPVPPGQAPADAARTTPADPLTQEFGEPTGRYTATATPSASPQTAPSEPAQANRQYRRDPAFRERVRELHAVNAPTSEIAAQLGTSSRTIRRILADLDAESDASGRQSRNPAQAAVSNWHNGFRVLPGGNTTAAPGSVGKGTAEERTPHRADRSMEQ